MPQVNDLLTRRLNKKESGPSKMKALAARSSQGNLSGFAGVFSVNDLNEKEKESLLSILQNYSENETDLNRDYQDLISITSEVKAINNQAALLHGQRIQRARNILKHYRDGAFTAWLMGTYGNRQTPYNFLQYYEFYESLPEKLKELTETMPRQAIYTLASREGDPKKKEEIISSYRGETKEILLEIIRDTFPLEEKDRRRRDPAESAIKHLIRALHLLTTKKLHLTKQNQKTLSDLLTVLEETIQ